MYPIKNFNLADMIENKRFALQVALAMPYHALKVATIKRLGQELAALEKQARA